MRKFTVSSAKKEIERLTTFIQLAEEAERLDEQGLLTLEEKAIKEYAFLGKLQEVATKLNQDGFQLNNKPITATQVTKTLKVKHNFGWRTFLMLLHRNVWLTFKPY